MRGYGDDEPAALREALPGVPVFADPDRVRSAGAAAAAGATVALLDDGFQHLRLRRCLDLLLVDATCPFGHGHVLPRGLLREPLSAARRADVLVLTRCDLAPDLERTAEALRLLHASAPQVRTVHVPDRLLSAVGPPEPAAALRGRRVHLLSGIGNPASFRALAEREGAEVRAVTALGDHHRYTRGDVEVALERTAAVGAEWLVTTTKDLVKLRPLLRPREEVRTLTVRVEVIAGREKLEALLDGVRTRRGS